MRAAVPAALFIGLFKDRTCLHEGRTSVRSRARGFNGASVAGDSFLTCPPRKKTSKNSSHAFLQGFCRISWPPQPATSSFPQVCFLYWHQFNGRLRPLESFARDETLTARPRPLRWTPRLGSSRGGRKDTQHLKREVVIIARQQKGHDGFALLRKCWPPTLGDVGGQLFFSPLFAPSRCRYGSNPPETYTTRTAPLTCARLSGYHELSANLEQARRRDPAS